MVFQNIEKNKPKDVRLLIVLALLFVNFWNVIGQEVMPGIQKVEDKYNQLGGRFMDVINPMVEDSLGFLWIGSKKGLCRYTGSTITCFAHEPSDPNSLSGNDIENLMIDSHHQIWVAMNANGVDVFDINGQKLKSFQYDPNDDNSISSSRVWGMFEDQDGYVWLSYFNGGLSRYDKELDSFTHYSIDSKEFLETERPKTVVKAAPHRTEPHTFWLSTTRGLVKFNTRTQDYKNFLFYSEETHKEAEFDRVGKFLQSNWNRDMIIDRHGILWLGCYGGLVRFDPKTEKYIVFFDMGDYIIKSPVGVYEYDEEHILLSCNNGIILFNTKEQKGVRTERFIDPSSPWFLHVKFFRASNGCLYMINSNGKRKGIYKSCDSFRGVTSFYTGYYVESILVTDNYVHYYIPKGGHIESRKLSTGEKKRYKLDKKDSESIKAMEYLTGDSILFADYLHLYKYHPDGKPERQREFEINKAYRYESLLKDSEGNIWTGRQRDGLHVKSKKDNKIRHLNHRSDPALVYQDYIEHMREDEDGDIWFATEQGWTVLDKKKNTTKNYHIDDIAYKYNIDLRTISDIAQDESGFIWISDDVNGVLKWDKEKEEVISYFSQNDSLRSGGVYEMLVDKEDLWIGSEKGLVHINTKTSKVNNFGKEYGIRGAVFSLSMGKGGLLYAGHGSGYYILKTDKLKNISIPKARPIITGFNIYDESFDSLLYKQESISLTHDQNFVSFEFGSKNFHTSDLESYEYRLVNLDRKWIPAKGTRMKGYTDLGPGSYTFEVRLKTNENWSQSTKLDIVIQPPWWKTLWFRLLFLVVLGAVGYGFLRLYINRQKKDLEYEKRFAQLETMILKSQMNPHFLFNSLNSIRYLFMKDEKEKGIKYITKFAKLLRTSLHLGESALVKLEDEVELTELYISLEQLRFDDKFSLMSKYEDTGSWKNIEIPPFVIQPLVENAFWHGLSQSKEQQKILKLEIVKQEDGYSIVIEDNGVGMNKSKSSNDPELGKKKSYGLSLIKERFELLNKTQSVNFTIDVDQSQSFKTGTLIIINIKNLS